MPTARALTKEKSCKQLVPSLQQCVLVRACLLIHCSKPRLLSFIPSHLHPSRPVTRRLSLSLGFVTSGITSLTWRFRVNSAEGKHRCKRHWMASGGRLLLGSVRQANKALLASCVSAPLAKVPCTCCFTLCNHVVIVNIGSQSVVELAPTVVSSLQTLGMLERKTQALCTQLLDKIFTPMLTDTTYGWPIYVGVLTLL